MVGGEGATDCCLNIPRGKEERGPAFVRYMECGPLKNGEDRALSFREL